MPINDSFILTKNDLSFLSVLTANDLVRSLIGSSIFLINLTILSIGT